MDHEQEVTTLSSRSHPRLTESVSTFEQSQRFPYTLKSEKHRICPLISFGSQVSTVFIRKQILFLTNNMAEEVIHTDQSLEDLLGITLNSPHGPTLGCGNAQI